jgi:hypothetical protein
MSVITRQDKVFVSFTVFLAAILLGFVFWLGFPGYFQEGDIYNSLSVTLNHWHPVIIARFLEGLYYIIGKHSFYLFFLNIFCFYSGLCLFVIALYLRTKNALWIVLFLATLVGNIFFQNFIQYHSFTFPMLVWLGSAMIFFYILVDIKSKALTGLLYVLIFLIFLLALMWRHNAILTMFPLFAIFVHLVLKRFPVQRSSVYVFRFASLMFLGGLLMVFLVKVHPIILAKNVSKITANHIFLHQIVAMIVPEDDSKFIPQEWYEKNKTFNDVKEMYAKYPTVADPFNVGWEPYNSNRPFKRAELKDLKVKWVESIITYPDNYVKHVLRYYKEMWFQEPGWIFSSSQMQAVPVHPWHVSIAAMFPEKERHVSFSKTRAIIYDFLYNNKILFNNIVGIALAGLVFFVSCILWMIIKFRTDVLFFSLSSSCSALCTAIFIPLFVPYSDSRYMSPVLVLSVISSIGFLGYMHIRFIRSGQS